MSHELTLEAIVSVLRCLTVVPHPLYIGGSSSGPAPISGSLKRPRALAVETESLPQARQFGGSDSEPPLLSARAENTGTPRRQHERQHQQQHQPDNVHDGCRDGDGSLPLPWLADRFYLNVLASLRDGQQSDWQLSRDSKRSSGNCSSDNNDINSNSHRSDGSVTEGGYENGPFFSLERLVEVVSGDGRPGIKAALFGTFSLEMGYVSSKNSTMQYANEDKRIGDGCSQI